LCTCKTIGAQLSPGKRPSAAPQPRSSRCTPPASGSVRACAARRTSRRHGMWHVCVVRRHRASTGTSQASPERRTLPAPQSKETIEAHTSSRQNLCCCKCCTRVTRAAASAHGWHHASAAAARQNLSPPSSGAAVGHTAGAPSVKQAQQGGTPATALAAGSRGSFHQRHKMPRRRPVQVNWRRGSSPPCWHAEARPTCASKQTKARSTHPIATPPPNQGGERSRREGGGGSAASPEPPPPKTMHAHTSHTQLVTPSSPPWLWPSHHPPLRARLSVWAQPGAAGAGPRHAISSKVAPARESRWPRPENR